jgi:hypothetical protein
MAAVSGKTDYRRPDPARLFADRAPRFTHQREEAEPGSLIGSAVHKPLEINSYPRASWCACRPCLFNGLSFMARASRCAEYVLLGALTLYL